jgi:hypothetical protein
MLNGCVAEEVLRAQKYYLENLGFGRNRGIAASGVARIGKFPNLFVSAKQYICKATTTSQILLLM